MKTIEEIQKDCIGKVFKTEDFIKDVEEGYFNEYDGIGYMHNGEDELDIGVFRYIHDPDRYNEYFPYVCWYNK